MFSHFFQVQTLEQTFFNLLKKSLISSTTGFDIRTNFFQFLNFWGNLLQKLLVLSCFVLSSLTFLFNLLLCILLWFKVHLEHLHFLRVDVPLLHDLAPEQEVPVPQLAVNGSLQGEGRRPPEQWAMVYSELGQFCIYFLYQSKLPEQLQHWALFTVS